MAVFTAIGASMFGAGTLMAGISAAALQIAAGVALNYFFAGYNGQTDQTYAGMQGQLQVGAEVARTVPFGLGLAEHSLAYANYWGQDGKTPNAYLTQVFCLADYPVKGLAEFYLDGVKEAPLWGEAGAMGAPVPSKRRNGQDYAWVKFYDGTQTVADPWLVSQFGNHPERPYKDTRVGHGCPYLILTTRVHEEFWSGWPQIKAVLSGARLYDISRDSTRGGNGSQRIGLPNTWGGDGDDLTAVQAYALMMGIRFNGQWLYGLQSLPLAQLPNDWWVSQINACRASVVGPNGPEPTYRSGGSIRVSQPIADTLTSLATSCQGRLVEVGGEYRFHVGMAQAPVYHITDGDVISTEPRRFTPFLGLAETINGIAATHPSPENGWNTLPLPTLVRPDLEARDGNRRLLTNVSLDLVPYEWQCQRVMASALAEGRQERSLTLAMPGSFYRALPGEWVSFTSADNGFIDKLFRLDGVVDRDDGHVVWDMTEIDPDDYDPDFSTYVPPVSGSLQPGNVPTQTIVAWAVTADTIKDDLGRPRRPAVRFHWDPDVEDVRAVGFQLRTATEKELVLDESSDHVSAGSLAWASARILPDQMLEGRGRYYSASGTVPQRWTGWLPVKTDNIGVGPDDLAPGLREDLENFQEFMNEDVPVILDELEDIGNDLEALAGAPQFVFGQAYAAGDLVRYLDGIYRARVPNDSALPTDPLSWDKVGEYNSIAGTVLGFTARFEQVETSVEQAENRIVQTTQDTRRIQNALLAAAMLNAEQGQGQVLENTDALAASATVSETMRTEVSRIDGTTMALAEQINVVQAQVEEDVAEAISAVTTKVEDVDGRVTAEAQRVDQLRAVIGNSGVEVLMKGAAVAAPAGFTARWAIRLQTTDNGVVIGNGMIFVDIRADGTSRIGLQANNTAFFLADGTPIALFDENGDFRNPSGTVRIGMLTAGDFSFGGA